MKHLQTWAVAMSRRRFGAAAALGLVTGPCTVFAARAREDRVKFETLHDFGDPSDVDAGSVPLSGLVQAADGHLYGTTQQGGSGDGTIFRVEADGQGAARVHTVHAFDHTVDGGAPESVLIQGLDGALYGTLPAYSSGPCQDGSIFRLQSDGRLQTIHAFDFGGHQPSGPRGGLVLASDGNYYGTTTDGGGAFGGGAVYRMGPTGIVRTLFDFTQETTSADGPIGELIQGTDGLLYGVTETSAENFGTVYSLTLDGQFRELHAFHGSDGSFPWARLLQASDGRLYGTTSGAGNHHAGSLFRLSPEGFGFEAMTLSRYELIGNEPTTPLIQARDGTLYGTTSSGGPQGGGCVFQLTSSYRRLVQPFGATCSGPRALIQATDGAFYGVAQAGGAFGGGVLFRIVDPGA